MSKDISISKVLSLVYKLLAEVYTLRKENKKLQQELDKYRVTKDSSNSSMPPSSDLPKPKKTQSLRAPSGNKPGGQPGHKGNTLRMAETPGVVRELKPVCCAGCGCPLDGHALVEAGRRQVIDIPPVVPVVTEYRVFKGTCKCGHQTVAQYPCNVETTVSYGANVQSLVAYLSVRQYMPVARIAEFFASVLGLKISTGGICYLLDKTGRKAATEYESIRQSVVESPIIGADETGVNINGKNHWAWAFQSTGATYIAVHAGRGTKAIGEIMPEGFDNNILVTDCWPSYFKKGAMSHQICTAHLQRDLNYLAQRFPANTWVKRLSGLIGNAIEMHRSGNLRQVKVDEIHRSFDLLLKEPASEKNIKELKTFQERMVKYQDYVFAFLDKPEIPPDNNASERAIRNFKVKQKVSGFFKSDEGADTYSIFRSIIDTSIKNGQNPYLTLKTIAFR